MSTLIDIIPGFSYHEEDILRAIFSQITAEVRKKGLILDEEDGSFYVSKRFSWKTTVTAFFDSYHKICERKQVPPIYQESKIKSALKVPYASIDTINLFRDAAIKRLIQFQEHKIPPFSKLPAKPTPEDLIDIRDHYVRDKDYYRFINLVLQIDSELRRYAALLSELVNAYQNRITAFDMAYGDIGYEAKIKKRFRDSKHTIIRILSPYVKKLKRIHAVPSSWQYSFKMLPLTEDGKYSLARMAKASGSISYWNNDTLPFKVVRDKDTHKRRREYRKAEKEAARLKKREERARRKLERRAHIHARALDVSRSSLWYRFDKWVTGIGNRLSYNIDSITDWLMKAWIVLAIIWAIIAVIIIWIEEGLFIAVLVVAIGLAIIGVLEAVAGLIAGLVKLVSYIPLYIIRVVFYRGWTLLLTLIVIIGYLAFLYLRAKSLISV